MNILDLVEARHQILFASTHNAPYKELEYVLEPITPKEILIAYENNPEKVNNDKHAIIALLKNLATNRSSITLHQRAWFEVLNQATLTNDEKIILRDLYFDCHNFHACRFPIIQGVKLKISQLSALTEAVHRNNDMYSGVTYGDVIMLVNKLTTKDCSTKTAKSMMVKFWLAFKAKHLRAEIVWAVLNNLDEAEKVQTIKMHYAYLDQLFTAQAFEMGIQYLHEVKKNQLESSISDEELSTLSQTARRKAENYLKNLHSSIEFDLRSVEVRNRMKLLLAEQLCRESYGVSKWMDQLKQLLPDTYMDTAIELVKRTDNEFDDLKLPDDQDKLISLSRMTLRDAIIEIVHPVVALITGMSKEEMQAKYPSVYSLVPFMAGRMKLLAWISMEFKVATADILVAGLYDNGLKAFYYHNNVDELNKKKFFVLKNKDSRINQPLAYAIGYLMSVLEDVNNDPTFGKFSIKECMSLVYPKWQLDITESGELFAKWDEKAYNDDHQDPEQYIQAVASGMPISVIQTTKDIANKVSKQSDCFDEGLFIQRVLEAEVPASLKGKETAYFTAMLKMPWQAIYANWYAYILKKVQPKEVPQSFKELITLWAWFNKQPPEQMVIAMQSEMLSEQDTPDDISSAKHWVEIFEEMATYKPKKASMFKDYDVEINNGYRVSILKPGDTRAMIIGMLTGCCQHINGAASEVAISSYTEKNQGVLIVTAPSGRIVAQSLIWMDPFKEQIKELPKSFRSKYSNGIQGLIAIDSIESVIEHGEKVWDMIEKGYSRFAQDMIADGYIVAADDTSCSNVDQWFEHQKIKHIDFECPCDTQEELGYSDFDPEYAKLIVPKVSRKKETTEHTA